VCASMNQPEQHDDAGRDLTLVVTVGPDGRVLFHDLTEEMLEVARAVCAGDEDLQARLRVLESSRKARNGIDGR
jgi:hypothetical protein